MLCLPMASSATEVPQCMHMFSEAVLFAYQAGEIVTLEASVCSTLSLFNSELILVHLGHGISAVAQSFQRSC